MYRTKPVRMTNENHIVLFHVLNFCCHMAPIPFFPKHSRPQYMSVITSLGATHPQCWHQNASPLCSSSLPHLGHKPFETGTTGVLDTSCNFGDFFRYFCITAIDVPIIISMTQIQKTNVWNVHTWPNISRKIGSFIVGIDPVGVNKSTLNKSLR